MSSRDLLVTFFAAALLLTTMAGCGNQGGPGGNGSGGNGPSSTASQYGYEFPIQAGKYTILGILTDAKDHAKAKANAEDTITNHPDINCMVGLWAYNPPAILQAAKGAKKLDQIKIVGFDEDPETLAAIGKGEIHATVVQQPFLFGYRSVELLGAIARGQQVDIPEDKMIYVPHTVVNGENVEDFKTTIEKMRTGRGDHPKPLAEDYDTSRQVRIAFCTNSVDPFWQLAEQGVLLAEPKFQVDCKFYQPPDGLVEQQKAFIEDMITDKREGLAISPIDPDNQIEMINAACAVMPVVCQDSDAPGTNRKFYLGTSNYQAGQEAGRLVKEALPEGGKVMIFVGKMEVLNAQERAAGLIDQLKADK